MTELEQELLEADEYVCVNAKLGDLLHDYVDGILAETERKRFENHLIFCQKCQDDVAYFQWMTTTLNTRQTEIHERQHPPVVRFADAIASEIGWELMEQAAAGIQEEHTFELTDGRIEVTCEWESPKQDHPGYIVIWWKADIESDRELSIQFFRKDTRELLYEEEIGTIRNSHAQFTFDELGFDPEHEQWAIAVV